MVLRWQIKNFREIQRTPEIGFPALIQLVSA